MAALATPQLETDSSAQDPELVLTAGPMSRWRWARSLWEHRQIMAILARKDFKTRYKRASLGMVWAVALPLVQASTMIFVFSHFVRAGRGVSYGAFVLSGILAWSYFAVCTPAATTSIVDGTTLTDKVWFPRALLPLVPCLSGLVALGVSMVILLGGAPLLGAPLGARTLLLIPACLLLVAFTIALALVLAALQVYFRDVKFIANAALMVWLYATPVMYPQSAVGSLGPWLDVNPLTGVVTLFHLAITGSSSDWLVPLLVSLGTTGLLAVVATEVHRRHDRLFVDLL